MSDHKKVVVAVDSSPFAESALQWATRNAVRGDDELHLVTVVKPIAHSTSVTGDPADAWLHPPKQELEAADQLLERYRREAQQAGVGNVSTERVVAEVGGREGVGISLQQAAQRTGADTMVVGSRGMGSITRSVLSAVGLGSVSDYCVRHAPCNVMVVKPGQHKR